MPRYLSVTLNFYIYFIKGLPKLTYTRYHTWYALFVPGMAVIHNTYPSTILNAIQLKMIKCKKNTTLVIEK